MKFMKARQELKKLLIGQMYRSVRVDDWWGLGFTNGLWLVTQDLSSSQDGALKDLLAKADPPVLDTEDPEYIHLSIGVFRNRRKPITDVELAEDGALTLFFDDSWHLHLPTHTQTDWQWCLNESGKDPFTDAIVACYSSESIEIS